MCIGDLCLFFYSPAILTHIASVRKGAQDLLQVIKRCPRLLIRRNSLHRFLTRSFLIVSAFFFMSAVYFLSVHFLKGFGGRCAQILCMIIDKAIFTLGLCIHVCYTSYEPA